jgi:hypothetical protein
MEQNLRVGGEANCIQSVKPKLHQYHKLAHHEATEYLRTIYFALWESPVIHFYRPETIPRVSPAEKRNAISKLDDINLRLMDRNISNGLDLELGHIHWQHLIEKWNLIISTLDPRARVKGDQQMSASIAALSDMCNELQYPSGWTGLPPKRRGSSV